MSLALAVCVLGLIANKAESGFAVEHEMSEKVHPADASIQGLPVEEVHESFHQPANFLQIFQDYLEWLTSDETDEEFPIATNEHHLVQPDEISEQKRLRQSQFVGARGKKAAGMGFFGARGKKAAPSGFFGARGKKSFSEELDEEFDMPKKPRAAYSGFFGARGKKAPSMGFFGARGKKAPHMRFYGSRGKKAPKMGFFGARGKKDPTEQSIGVNKDFHEVQNLDVDSAVKFLHSLSQFVDQGQ
uniref:Urechistachykinin n=1 Tax=Urechis unicinctus TaxID=6432 RepID=Q9U8X8_UREUN|nr:Urechistachykinin precursor [Urechis unicinctus]